MNVVSFFHQLFILIVILCFDHDYQQKKKGFWFRWVIV